MAHAGCSELETCPFLGPCGTAVLQAFTHNVRRPLVNTPAPHTVLGCYGIVPAKNAAMQGGALLWRCWPFLECLGCSGRASRLLQSSTLS